MKDIPANDLVPLNIFEWHYPIEIDLVYAQPDHKDNKFFNLYDSQSTILWAHKDLAKIVLLASKICKQQFGWTLKLNDSLRPIEAQEGMLKYNYHQDLVSPPGAGAHPRAMAVDIEPTDKSGTLVNMGTNFDHFVNDPTTDENPADRSYIDLAYTFKKSIRILSNRNMLESAMKTAAQALKTEVYPLPQEWWDFRLLDSLTNKFNPLSETDLFPWQRLMKDIDREGVKSIMKSNLPIEIQPAIQEVLKAISNKQLHIKDNQLLTFEND